MVKELFIAVKADCPQMALEKVTDYAFLVTWSRVVQSTGLT
jgi:hypothetical protein